MSGINGDKARFNRQRKKNIAKRARNSAQFGSTKPAAAAVQSKPSANNRKQVQA